MTFGLPFYDLLVMVAFYETHQSLMDVDYLDIVTIFFLPSKENYCRERNPAFTYQRRYIPWHTCFHTLIAFPWLRQDIYMFSFLASVDSESNSSSSSSFTVTVFVGLGSSEKRTCFADFVFYFESSNSASNKRLFAVFNNHHFVLVNAHIFPPTSILAYSDNSAVGSIASVDFIE